MPEETTAKPKKTVAEDKTEQFVRHIPAPGFSVRTISQDAWASIGVDSPTTEWTAANRFRIPVSEFSAKALNYLKGDDGFEIVEE